MIVTAFTFAACHSGNGGDNRAPTSASTECRLSPKIHSYQHTIVPASNRLLFRMLFLASVMWPDPIFTQGHYHLQYKHLTLATSTEAIMYSLSLSLSLSLYIYIYIYYGISKFIFKKVCFHRKQHFYENFMLWKFGAMQYIYCIFYCL